MASDTVTVDNVDELLHMLSNPDIQAATVTVLSKLPTIAKLVTVLELATDLVEPMIKDPELLTNVVTSVSSLAKPGMMESVNTLLDKLPLLVKTISYLELGMDLIEPMMKDPELLENVMQSVSQLAKPLTGETLQSALQLVDKLPSLAKLSSLVDVGADLLEPLVNHPELILEAKAKSAAEQSTISAFRILKLRKDPTVQRSLHLAIYLLQALNEQKKNR
ncbi:hypothetical protein [Sulfoacidibacillus thermotolerans]|uniref:DUF1641 domain-containing protein n=1 Tax=Sulfoacidibacillus thermotolerans TaxID=1765684 RepID=A0A2U3D6X6_SULT2|nr:hypothetical protein [Sulfoacidibacillus thermotolerans]PWI57032.1 hypothetical protein BM613_10750 [Sulfoacidibacillus thermotolerans]